MSLGETLVTTQQIQDLVDAAGASDLLRVNDLGTCVQLFYERQPGIEFYFDRSRNEWSKGGRRIPTEDMPYVLAAWRANTYAVPEWLFHLAAEIKKTSTANAQGATDER